MNFSIPAHVKEIAHAVEQFVPVADGFGKIQVNGICDDRFDPDMAFGFVDIAVYAAFLKILAGQSNGHLVV